MVKGRQSASFRFSGEAQEGKSWFSDWECKFHMPSLHILHQLNHFRTSHLRLLPSPSDAPISTQYTLSNHPPCPLDLALITHPLHHSVNHHLFHPSEYPLCHHALHKYRHHPHPPAS